MSDEVPAIVYQVLDDLDLICSQITGASQAENVTLDDLGRLEEFLALAQSLVLRMASVVDDAIVISR